MNAQAIVFGIIAMLGAILATGCSRGQTNKQPATEASDAQSYVVRGEVISIPLRFPTRGSAMAPAVQTRGLFSFVRRSLGRKQIPARAMQPVGYSRPYQLHTARQGERL